MMKSHQLYAKRTSRPTLRTVKLVFSETARLANVDNRMALIALPLSFFQTRIIQIDHVNKTHLLYLRIQRDKQLLANVPKRASED